MKKLEFSLKCSYIYLSYAIKRRLMSDKRIHFLTGQPRFCPSGYMANYNDKLTYATHNWLFRDWFCLFGYARVAHVLHIWSYRRVTSYVVVHFCAQWDVHLPTDSLQLSASGRLQVLNLHFSREGQSRELFLPIVTRCLWNCIRKQTLKTNRIDVIYHLWSCFVLFLGLDRR